MANTVSTGNLPAAAGTPLAGSATKRAMRHCGEICSGKEKEREAETAPRRVPGTKEEDAPF